MARLARTTVLSAVLIACLSMLCGSAGARSEYRTAVSAPGQPQTLLYAEEYGEGPTLVLLHGLGASTFTWRHILPALARDHRVIALDLKGFGRSDKPQDQNYSAADQAALVAAFIRKRELFDVTLIGHSFGGTVALLTALELNGEPNRIERLVIIDAPALKQNFSDVAVLLRAPGLPDAVMNVTSPELIARLLLRYVRAPGRDASEADIRGYAAPFYDLGSRHAFIATAQAILDANKRPMGARYRTIQQPTLLVWCRRDRIVPLATGRRLKRLLPNAHLALLKKCNHLPQDEVPKALLAKLQSFLER
jgi:pimeloyl-ACP methyl ester carboxylesterase